MEDLPAPLHLCHVSTKTILFNRSYMFLHAIALCILFFYRVSYFRSTSPAPPLAWTAVFIGELFLTFLWLLNQAHRWRPVRRTAFPEMLLPGDVKDGPSLLPPVDVFVCTADPDMEPTIDVMNTVMSAMALDYPLGRLHVYVSDDGGSPRTLNGMREAYEFARDWIPFCRKYGIRTICPKAYFEEEEEEEGNHPEYAWERKKMKDCYDSFEDNITKFNDRSHGDSGVDKRDHPFTLEIIKGRSGGVQQPDLPLLVYVAREKRPSYHHNFKAGAINVLLRVSALISNSPYLLVLDCDMRCNDPSSAKQAMCFYMDKKINSSLAFVQFPQRFHNISRNDIYDSQIRSVFSICWAGMDGLRGPVVSGTCFYMKRESLFRRPEKGLSDDITELRRTFGCSNELVRRLCVDELSKSTAGDLSVILEDTEVVASCEYETDTNWGKEVGFLYYSVTEDFVTSFLLHCRGWISVYLNPPRAQFLGTSTPCLNDLLVQGTRWSCGLVEVGLSRYCPMIYGPTRMSILQSMCYAELAFHPLNLIPVCCFAIVPPICLFYGASIYPEVSDPFSVVFPLVFVFGILKHLIEVLSSGHPARACINEQRQWMIKSVTCHVYGTVNAVLKQLGLRKSSFVPTNKVSDNAQLKRYEMGVFDFQTSPMFLVPMVSVVMLNAAAFTVGIGRAIVRGDWDRTLLHIMLSTFVLIMSYPVIEGIIIRKDKGRVAPSVTLLSALVCGAILVLGSFCLA